MAKINALTDEQLAALPVYAEKWRRIGLSTAPADRPAAEKAITLMYREAGLAPPAIIWAGSPIGAALTAACLKTAGDSVWDSVWDSVRASVWASVGDSVWDSVWASVWASVRDSVYGQHDAHWLGFYDFFRREFGLEAETDRLIGLTALAESAGWALPYQRVCVISERHDAVRLDSSGRIHCEDGPAIHYPDGFAVYGWHGTRVPREWIEDKSSLTAAAALTWKNIEQRRAACEIVGWEAILTELNAVTIDRDGDPEIGELVEVMLPDSGRERFLRVRCGTGRNFALPVPPDMESALQAQAWTWGVGPVDFVKPEIRT